MQWLKVSIYTSSEGIESVCGRVYALGITGVEIEDFNDFTDFLENNKQYWDYVDEELIEEKKGETRIIVYISDTADGMETLLSLKASIAQLKEYDSEGLYGRLEIETDTLNEEDWANNWKKYFHPMNVGKKLLICPEWEACENPENRVVFKINPGMTFGTGSHYTTRLCLEEIEKYADGDSVVADLGCGSGILSIVSLMLGAKHATAVDIDSNAHDIAYANAQRNDVDKSAYRVLTGNVLTDERLTNEIADRKYNLVCANIVADVIISLAPYAREIISDDGIFITSGIIEDRADEVSAAIEKNGFEIINRRREKDWVCFTCRAKNQ